MRARAGGNLTAVLMFVILMSVPFLAIFGIPEFVPASISPFEEHENAGDDELNFASSLNRAGDAPVFSMSDSPDAFLSARENPFVSRRESQEGSELPRDPFLHVEQEMSRPSTPRGLAGWEQASGPTGVSESEDLFVTRTSFEETVSTNPGNPVVGHSLIDASAHVSENGASSEKQQEQSQTDPLTWTAAVRRLNKLGIHDFRLEPGSRPDYFCFYCFVASANNSQVTHRFEAEAIDPLHAVKKVLEQIDRWSRKQ